MIDFPSRSVQRLWLRRFLTGRPTLLDFRGIWRGLRRDQFLSRALLFGLWRIRCRFGLHRFLLELWSGLWFARLFRGRRLLSGLRGVSRRSRHRLSRNWRFFLCFRRSISRWRRDLRGFSGGLRGHHALALEFAWPGGRGNCRLAAVRGRELLASHTGRARLTGLQRGCPNARLLSRQPLFVGGLCDDTARSAIEAGIVDRRVIDDILRVDIRDLSGADVIHSGVVEEASAVPPTALIA